MCSSPIRGPLDPRDKHIHISRVSEDTSVRRDRENESLKESESNLGALAFLLQLFKKTVDFFIAASSGSKSIASITKKDLLEFKAGLETLKTEDRSQDAQFLNALSITWQRLLEDSLQFKKDTTASKLKSFLRSIQNYPERQLHTLGFYLSESKTQDWVPFPFMELIQKIHSEHEKNPMDSELTQWILSIEELVAHLQVH